MTSTAFKNAASGMMAAQTQTDVLSHAIANSQTSGYKQQDAVFATVGSISKSRAGSLSSTTGSVLPVGIQIGLGTKVAGVTTNMKQGSPVSSGNPNHVMIRGNGYFQIELPSGEVAYTRAGTFELGPNGELVTLDGFILMPGINIPQNALSFEVSKNGQVSAKMPGQIAPQFLGQIELASFANPAGLEAIESNMFLETTASGTPVVGQPGSDGFGSLLQNWYEGSNVNSVLSITQLLESQRLFEFNAKVIKAGEKMSDAELAAI
jgi:flagellar basal-body rod protein FlgG